MERYTAALVGCGRIGFSLGLDEKREQPASHTMALLGNSRVNLIAGCDTDSERLSEWKKFVPGAEVFDSSEKLCEKIRPDIIAIAVNESAHKKEAIAAIRSRPKLVILEKPVALNMAEAKEILSESEKAGVPVLVNHERRFAEDFKLAKRCMEKIGDVQSIRADLYSSLCVYNPAEENSGAYSLIHDGTHLVDAALFFLEDDGVPSGLVKNPSRKKFGSLMKAALNLRRLNSDVNSILNSPVMTGVFRDEKNCVRQMSAHYASEKCPDITISMSGRSRFFGFEIAITGREGRVCIGNGYLKFYRRHEAKLYTGFYSLASEEDFAPPKKTLYFANMVQNAVDFLDGKERLRSTLQTGINALAVLEEMKSKII